MILDEWVDCVGGLLDQGRLGKDILDKFWYVRI